MKNKPRWLIQGFNGTTPLYQREVDASQIMQDQMKNLLKAPPQLQRRFRQTNGCKLIYLAVGAGSPGPVYRRIHNPHCLSVR
jgi:hypothetical protein